MHETHLVTETKRSSSYCIEFILLKTFTQKNRWQLNYVRCYFLQCRCDFEGFWYNLWTMCRCYISVRLAISSSQNYRWVWRTLNICIARGPRRHARVLLWSLHIELGLPTYLHGPIVLLNVLYGNKWEIHIALHFPSLKFQLMLWLHAAH